MKWTADFTNDPLDDYNLIIEIMFDGKEIAVIKREYGDLVIKFYTIEEGLNIPFEWMFGLMQEAKMRL